VGLNAKGEMLNTPIFFSSTLVFFSNPSFAFLLQESKEEKTHLGDG